MLRDRWVNACLAYCLKSVLNVKAVVAAFNQGKALVGAFSVITNLRMDLFEALSRNLTISAARQFSSSVTPHSSQQTPGDAALMIVGINHRSFIRPGIWAGAGGAWIMMSRKM